MILEGANPKEDAAARYHLGPFTGFGCAQSRSFGSPFGFALKPLKQGHPQMKSGTRQMATVPCCFAFETNQKQVSKNWAVLRSPLKVQLLVGLLDIPAPSPKS